MVEGVTGDLAPVVVHFASMSSPNRLVKTGCGLPSCEGECRRLTEPAIRLQPGPVTAVPKKLLLAPFAKPEHAELANCPVVSALVEREVVVPTEAV